MGSELVFIYDYNQERGYAAENLLAQIGAKQDAQVHTSNVEEGDGQYPRDKVTSLSGRYYIILVIGDELPDRWSQWSQYCDKNSFVSFDHYHSRGIGPFATYQDLQEFAFRVIKGESVTQLKLLSLNEINQILGQTNNLSGLRAHFENVAEVLGPKAVRPSSSFLRKIFSS